MKKEKFEKDLKAKNIELADLIRERDRARLDLDRVKATKDQDIEKLQAELRELNSQVNESGKLQSLNLSSIISKHQNEMDQLKKQLSVRDKDLSNLGNNNLQEKLKEKEMDLEIAQESLDSALRELAISKNDQEDIVNAQIDHIIISNISKLRKLVDILLANNIKRIQDTKYELASPMQAGNLNSSPEHLLSIVEISSDMATDFATTFNTFIVDEKHSYNDDNSSYSGIILKGSELTTAVNDLMLNAKGISRSLSKDDEDSILKYVSNVLVSTEAFFFNLSSDSLSKVEDEDGKIDKVIDCNLQVQNDLQLLGNYVDTLRSTHGINFSLGNLEDLVKNEMEQTANTVDLASKFLKDLLQNPNIKSGNFEIHETLLSAAMAVTNAVALLIKRLLNHKEKSLVKEWVPNHVRNSTRKIIDGLKV